MGQILQLVHESEWFAAWVGKISASVQEAEAVSRQAVGAYVEAGRQLIDAKKDLGQRGQWLRLPEPLRDAEEGDDA